MTSHILSFLKLFGPKAARTSTAPNSWAAVCLWRKFLQMKEHEEEEKIQVVMQALEEEWQEQHAPPITGPAVIEARTEFLQEHYRPYLHPTLFSTTSPSAQVVSSSSSSSLPPLNSRESVDQQRLHHPRLDIPVDEHQAMYLAQ